MSESNDEDSTGDQHGEDESEREARETAQLQLSGTDLKLYRALMSFKSDVQDRVRDLLRSKKAAEQLCRSGALENLELVEKYADWLREADLTPIEMDDRREKAVESLDKFVRQRRNRRRMKFMQGLHGLADSAGIEIEKLSESPLTLYLEPFVVEPDFDTDAVELTYAHEHVVETDLEPEAVLDARNRGLEAIEERTLPSEEFFERLRRAYQLALTSERKAEGERVELANLLGPLGLLASETEAWRDPQLEDVRVYPKYLLAHQLREMRRDGMLSRDGVRVDLGTATGGSARDKEGVVFIPSNGADGQYFLSIRFVDEET